MAMRAAFVNRRKRFFFISNFLFFYLALALLSATLPSIVNGAEDRCLHHRHRSWRFLVVVSVPISFDWYYQENNGQV